MINIRFKTERSCPFDMNMLRALLAELYRDDAARGSRIRVSPPGPVEESIIDFDRDVRPVSFSSMIIPAPREGDLLL